jgi:hypothetical protein
MADEPRLNSIDRFRKRPGRLVLEAYSHCEVPAGCGGVVLRWRNPFAAVPVIVLCYTPGQAPCILDGVPLENGRPDLAPGRHVVAFALQGINPADAVIAFAALADAKRDTIRYPTLAVEGPLNVLSADDGTWRFTLDQPAGDPWTAVSFDDHNWQALVAAPPARPGRYEEGGYQCERCIEAGAVFLGLPPRGADEEPISWWRRLLGRRANAAPDRVNVWIRRVFEVEPPALGPGEA